MVIDFAVEDEMEGAVFVGHRLCATVQIDDGEATVCQHGLFVVPHAAAVGAAVELRLVHRLGNLHRDRHRLWMNDSCNRTHGIGLA